MNLLVKTADPKISEEVRKLMNRYRMYPPHRSEDTPVVHYHGNSWSLDAAIRDFSKRHNTPHIWWTQKDGCFTVWRA